MRYNTRVIAALLLCLFVAACDSVEERAEGHYQNALALIEEGDFDRATIEFRNVFELIPVHREARESYAQMLMDNGNLRGAYGQFARIAESFPDDVKVRETLTRMAMDSQNWDEVRRHGEPLIALSPDLLTARVAALTLEYVDALENEDGPAQSALAADARRLSEEASDYSVLNFLLIQQALLDNEPEVALAQMDGLLAQDDTQLPLHMLRLQVLASLQRTDEVESSLIALIDQFPENNEFLVTLLQFYGSEGRADDAIAYLRTYVASREESQEAANTLIELVAETRGAEAGLAEVDRLLEADPANLVLTMQRARLQFGTGDRDAGISAIEAMIAANDAEGDVTSEIVNDAKMVLARMLIATGNQVGARRQVEEVLAADSSNVVAMKMQANWLIEDDKPDEAVTLLRTALDVSPEDWEAMSLMADAFTRTGDHELARDFISLATETSGHALVPSLRFANLLVSEDRLLLAEETLVNALRRTPDNLELLAALGRVQMAREDWPRVAQLEGTLRRIGTTESNRVAAGLEVARLAGTQRTDEAMEALETLGASDGSVQTVAAVIRARLASGDRDGALEQAQEALAENPDDIAMKLVLASTQLGIGEFEAGRTLFEEVLSENDQVEAAWTALIRIEAAIGDADSRDAVLDRALEAIPDSLGLGWAKASVLTEKGDADGAIAMYEELYAQDTSSLVLANNLATLLANHRDDEASIERAYTVARRLRGSDVAAFQDTYGWIAFRRGELDEAERYLANAVEALPMEPSVQYHLASVYLAQDRKAEALKHFLLAAESDGNRQQFPEIDHARTEADALIAEGVSPSE